MSIAKEKQRETKHSYAIVNTQAQKHAIPFKQVKGKPICFVDATKIT